MLDQTTMDFLESRSIDPEMASRYGINTANIHGMKHGQSVLGFAYVRGGIVQHQKYRLLPKERFWQDSGRKSSFWNADALDDPGLQAGTLPLVICEGEFDAMTAIQCGFPLSVSVPDGAPPEAAWRDNAESVGPDQTGRYEFLWRDRDKVKRVKRFILAVDDDGPGRRLREELIRRLSASRCSFVEYPLGCKDLNDVLVKHGPEAVAAVLNAARQCPVQGLYRLSDYPDEGELQAFSTGWPLLDRCMQLFLGEFMVITGIPQHGKSSFVLHLMVNMARLHHWRCALFSPEMKIVPVVRDRLRSIRAGKSAHLCTPEMNAWIDDMFLFIGADPAGRDVPEQDFDLEWIIDKATEAVLRDGIRLLIIDPWNEVEHARRRDETMTEYVARSIRMLKRFARAYNVAVIVVAHPTKLVKKADGRFDAPSLYDISDSAAWYNKCDHGVVVFRRFDPPQTEVIVAKSRFDEAGEAGSVRMVFDAMTHQFAPLTTQDGGAIGQKPATGSK